MYYRPRSLSWLLKHAGRKHIVSQNKEKERQHADDMEEAHIVLSLDGGTLRCEKSHGGREQMTMFDWGKDERELRVLVLATVGGVIVEITEATGGRSTEVEIAESMTVLERFDEEAQETGALCTCILCSIRGFITVGLRCWSALTRHSRSLSASETVRFVARQKEARLRSASSTPTMKRKRTWQLPQSTRMSGMRETNTLACSTDCSISRLCTTLTTFWRSRLPWSTTTAAFNLRTRRTTNRNHLQ